MNEDRQKTAEALAKAISQGRTHMEKCFACAFEAIQVLSRTEEDDELDELVPLEPMYQFIEKEFGLELVEEAREIIRYNLVDSFIQHQAMTTCLIWGLGHAIEHATMLSSPTLRGEVVN